MADFGDLLGDIEETQPTQPLSGYSSSIQDPGGNIETQDENDPVGDDAIADESDGAEIPTALQEAMIRRESRAYDEEVQDDDSLEKNEKDASDRIDYQMLKQIWIQEINTSELCRYNEELIDILLDLLQENEDNLEELQEQGRTGADPTLSNIAANICKMDMDRLSFVISDLMRIRLEKIEKYHLHNRDFLDRMSQREIDYHHQYSELVQKHMERSVTSHFGKDAWKKLDDPEMIDRPNLDTFVFCKVIDPEGINIDNWEGMKIDPNEEDDDLGDGRISNFEYKSQMFVRYRAVRELVEEGKIELIM